MFFNDLISPSWKKRHEKHKGPMEKLQKDSPWIITSYVMNCCLHELIKFWRCYFQSDFHGAKCLKLNCCSLNCIIKSYHRWSTDKSWLVQKMAWYQTKIRKFLENIMNQWLKICWATWNDPAWTHFSLNEKASIYNVKCTFPKATTVAAHHTPPATRHRRHHAIITIIHFTKFVHRSQHWLASIGSWCQIDTMPYMN